MKQKELVENQAEQFYDMLGLDKQTVPRML